MSVILDTWSCYQWSVSENLYQQKEDIQTANNQRWITYHKHITYHISHTEQSYHGRFVHLRQTNLEVCLKLIQERGYSCQAYLLDACWYGLAQSRRRVYIVCLLVGHPGLSVSGSDFFASVKGLLQALQIAPPNADSRLGYKLINYNDFIFHPRCDTWFIKDDATMWRVNLIWYDIMIRFTYRHNKY